MVNIHKFHYNNNSNNNHLSEIFRRDSFQVEYAVLEGLESGVNVFRRSVCFSTRKEVQYD